MPLYLLQATYTAEGTKGLMKDGGTKRKQAVSQMVEKAGGKLHSFYYALGETDVFSVVEFPDHATALAVSVAVNSVGVVHLRSTVLLLPEEVDAATKKSIPYRPPGA
ncbi:MAG TPA: GYD domain-containing protein [Gemmatimonadales bacterium]|jgi:uncharacterized protein with GYD domain